VAWNPGREWRQLAGMLRPRSGRGASGWPAFWMHLAYLAGFLDGAARRRLRRAGFRRSRPLVVRHRCLPTAEARGRVALSIDDGPSEATPRLLALLERHRATATFFLVGNRARRLPRLVEQVVRCGHEVYGHGWSHRRLDGMRTAEVAGEMERTEAVLRRHRPTPSPYLVRLPFGAGADDDHVHQALRRWNAHCQIVQWSAASEDWVVASASRSARDLEARCTAATQRLLAQPELPGSIVLTHDSPIGTGAFSAEVSVRLLEHVLEGFARRGLAATSIGRLS
jgi:peptidoglycan/xylan/chitin deacetylase (PgdA/CDA1 family)